MNRNTWHHNSETAGTKRTEIANIKKVEESRTPLSSLLALEDPELEAALLAGNPAYRDLRYEPLKKRLDY